MHSGWKVVLVFFFRALEVTSGLSHQCQRVLAAEITPACLSFSLLLTALGLSISLLFNGQLFVSADACLSHDAYRTAAASFPSGPIKLQTPVREHNKGRMQILTKGIFWIRHSDSGKHYQQ